MNKVEVEVKLGRLEVSDVVNLPWMTLKPHHHTSHTTHPGLAWQAWVTDQRNQRQATSLSAAATRSTAQPFNHHSYHSHHSQTSAISLLRSNDDEGIQIFPELYSRALDRMLQIKDKKIRYFQPSIHTHD